MIMCLLGLSLAQSDQTMEVRRILSMSTPSKADYKRVRQLGDSAFPDVLNYVRANANLAEKETLDSSLTLINLLLACATPKRTPEVLGLFALANDRAKRWLFWWLSDHGDPRRCRKVFAESLQGTHIFEPEHAAKGLGRIGDDAAVETLTKASHRVVLQPYLGAICMGLAVTRKPKALVRVRVIRDQGRTLPSLGRPQFIPELESRNGNVLSTGTDSKGRKWGLVKWDFLGPPDHLWIAMRRGNKWVEPVFTGVLDDWPTYVPSDLNSAGYKAHQSRMDALVRRRGWIKLIDSKTIRTDSDRDGLSNATELSLGLNPNAADTDRDSVPDDVDKNPLAPPTKLTDDELAVQAALNGYALGMKSRPEGLPSSLNLTLPPGYRHIELNASYVRVFPKGSYDSHLPPSGRYGTWLSVGGKPIPVRGDKNSLSLEFWATGSQMQQWHAKIIKVGTEWYCIELGAGLMAAA